jgi:hypothetical protein
LKGVTKAGNRRTGMTEEIAKRKMEQLVARSNEKDSVEEGEPEQR